ncbi:MAG: glycosyltransferase family 8 protein [Clostridia bacterium]|nr:glycosyltransferase family 8 protein [Clostridia bacterium]
MKMNILLTFNKGYLKQATVLLKSILHAHPADSFDVYVMNTALLPEDYACIEEAIAHLNQGRLTLHDVKVSVEALKDAPITKRYPKEMYFRIFAAHFLPEELDRVLYLDPDLVVINPITGLYTMNLDGCYFIAASHVRKPLETINAIRLRMEEPGPYINSGVMLIHLDALRKEQRLEQVYRYIEKHKNVLILPDQDVISALYGRYIRLVDPFIYNMSERQWIFNKGRYPWLSLSWIRKNSVVIHYCGRNKPWNEQYFGKLDMFYKHAQRL